MKKLMQAIRTRVRDIPRPTPRATICTLTCADWGFAEDEAGFVDARMLVDVVDVATEIAESKDLLETAKAELCEFAENGIWIAFSSTRLRKKVSPLQQYVAL